MCVFPRFCPSPPSCPLFHSYRPFLSLPSFPPSFSASPIPPLPFLHSPLVHPSVFPCPSRLAQPISSSALSPPFHPHLFPSFLPSPPLSAPLYFHHTSLPPLSFLSSLPIFPSAFEPALSSLPIFPSAFEPALSSLPLSFHLSPPFSTSVFPSPYAHSSFPFLPPSSKPSLAHSSHPTSPPSAFPPLSSLPIPAHSCATPSVSPFSLPSAPLGPTPSVSHLLSFLFTLLSPAMLASMPPCKWCLHALLSPSHAPILSPTHAFMSPCLNHPSCSPDPAPPFSQVFSLNCMHAAQGGRYPWQQQVTCLC
ncbi:unnamed protein product [Closterium sp. Naga37s-1]|nr:unnamed protein product [Closterium sp. Naga37s-1]